MASNALQAPRERRNLSRIGFSIFDLFLELPAELQLQIWHLAVLALGPRLINCRPMNFSKVGDDGPKTFTQCVAAPIFPALIHACHDSREVAMGRYKLCFEKQLFRPVYFDVSRDTLLFAHLQSAAVFLSAMKGDESWKGVKHQFIALDPSFHFGPDTVSRRDYIPATPFGSVASQLDHFKEIVVCDSSDPNSFPFADPSEHDSNKRYARNIKAYVESLQSYDAGHNPPKDWTCPTISYITRDELYKRRIDNIF